MISNKEKSAEQVNTLRKYIGKTILDDIPRNQFGRCNRLKILTSLDIKGSKDHPDVKVIFKMLDVKLGKSPAIKISRGDNEEYIKELQYKINELEKRIALISSELHTYKKFDGLIKHLLETGALAK